MWDIRTGSLHRHFEGHQDEGTRVAFSPNNQLIAAASLCGSVRLWSTVTHNELQPSFQHGAYLYLHVFPDRSHLETDTGALPLLFIPSSGAVTDTPATGLHCVKDQWLTCDLERLLWLPYEYKSYAMVARGNTIALGVR